jgi:hypothetical protein
MFAGGVLVYGVTQAESPGSSAASQVAAKTAPAQAVTRGSGTPGNVTQARVLAEAGRGDSWLVNGGNFESQHFSPLKSITDRNVGRLALAWAVDVPSPMGLSAEPIVDGVVYLGAPSTKCSLLTLRQKAALAIRSSHPDQRPVKQLLGGARIAVSPCGAARCRNRRLPDGGDRCGIGKQVGDAVCDADQTGITEAPKIGEWKVFTGWAGME